MQLRLSGFSTTEHAQPHVCCSLKRRLPYLTFCLINALFLHDETNFVTSIWFNFNALLYTCKFYNRSLLKLLLILHRQRAIDLFYVLKHEYLHSWSLILISILNPAIFKSFYFRFLLRKIMNRKIIIFNGKNIFAQF
jgi:hypothetical protein